MTYLAENVNYIRHIIACEDENGIQRCVVCGKVLHDPTGMNWPAGSEAPAGWPEGYLYVKDGNPIELTTLEPDTFIDCKNIPNE